MATTYITLPPTGASAYWHDAVADVPSLPASGNNQYEIRFVESDSSIRYWDGAAWQVLIAGAAGTYVLKGGDTMSGDLTISTLSASRAMATDGSKKLVSLATTATELGYVNGVTSAIQTQFTGKQASSTELTGVAALAATGMVARTASGTYAARTIAATSSKIAVTNGDGVAGAPSVDVTEANLTISNMGGTLALTHGGTGQTSSSAAFNALAPSTTKGDTIVNNGTGNTALAVGSNNTVIIADSALSNGIKWGQLPLTSGVSGTLPVANGGTNSASALSSGRMMVSAAGAVVESTVTVDGSQNVGSVNSMRVGASGTAGTSMALDVSSTTGALMLPRMTTTQKNALTAADGMVVFDSTLLKVQVRENGAWNSVTGWGA